MSAGDDEYDGTDDDLMTAEELARDRAGAGLPPDVEAAATAPGRAARAYRAYEAYVMAAPDDIEFAEWDELAAWQQEAIDAAVQAGIEATRIPSIVVSFDGTVTEERAAEIRETIAAAMAEPTIAGAAKIRDLERERDSLTGRVAELVTEGNELRALVTEILDVLAGSRLAEVNQFEKWRQRAGLET